MKNGTKGAKEYRCIQATADRMSANTASQPSQGLRDLDVRLARNTDAAELIAAVAEGHKASVRPLFLAALKKGRFDQILHDHC